MAEFGSRVRRCARGLGQLVKLSTEVTSHFTSESRPLPRSRRVLSLAEGPRPLPFLSSSEQRKRRLSLMCLLPALKRGADKRPESGWGAEGPRLEPGRAGGLYKAVRLRAGREPGSPSLYESPHGSAKSFTLGWFAGAPLHPSGLIPPSPPPQGSFGAKAALGPSRRGPGREQTPPSRIHSPLFCPRCGSRTDGPKNAG